MVVIVVVDGVGIIFLSGFKNLMCIKKKVYGGVYVPCIYTHASESYRRQLGSLSCVTYFER